MFKLALNFRFYFYISISLCLLCILYMTNSKGYFALSIGNDLMIHSSKVQDNYTMERAFEDLIDIVGTIPRFKPRKYVTCPRFPTIFDLQINNDIWQVLETTNGTFYLFGAYYDDRKKNINGPSVRIIGMANRLDPIVRIVCQLWYKDLMPIEVPISEYKLIWYRPWGVFNNRTVLYPYLITCDIPEGMQNVIPDAVSLVENPCDLASNNLVVNNNRVFAGKKKDFLVCVKGLDFPFDDYSVRLVEWIELLKLFGVDKIVFYNFNVHRNIEKVLNFYKQSIVEVRPMTLAGRQLNFGYYQHYYLHKRIVHKRFNELIPYNDCFYKNMYDYKYVVLLDIDEVILPILDETWQGLMQRMPNSTANSTYSSYSTQNVYFLDSLYNNRKYHEEIPKNLHMLQHIFRTKNFTKSNEYVKCFHDTEEIVTLHNHFAFECFTRAGNHTCKHFTIDRNLAQLNHYRENCKKMSELGMDCRDMKKDSVADETLWRFKDVLVKRVSKVAQLLGLSLS